MVDTSDTLSASTAQPQSTPNVVEHLLAAVAALQAALQAEKQLNEASKAIVAHDLASAEAQP